MAPVRLRHPKGIATIEVDFDSERFTVQDLLQEIFAVSEITPSQQDRKTHPLTSLEAPLAGYIDMYSEIRLPTQIATRCA